MTITMRTLPTEEQLNEGVNIIMRDQAEGKVTTGTMVKLLRQRVEILNLLGQFPIWEGIGHLFVDGTGKNIGQMNMEKRANTYWLRNQGVMLNPSYGDMKIEWFGLLRPLYHPNGEIKSMATWARFELIRLAQPELSIIHGADVMEVIAFYNSEPGHILFELDHAIEKGMEAMATDLHCLSKVREMNSWEMLLLESQGIRPNDRIFIPWEEHTKTVA